MLYGDLKTDNLLLDGGGNVRLADFGRAVILTQASSWLVTEAVGTEGYQAREMLTSRAYSFSSDLYSLGVTVYVMTVGRLPFRSRVDALAEAAPPFPEAEGGGRADPEGEKKGVLLEQARDFIARLLAPLSAGRLGAEGGAGVVAGAGAGAGAGAAGGSSGGSACALANRVFAPFLEQSRCDRGKGVLHQSTTALHTCRGAWRAFVWARDGRYAPGGCPPRPQQTGTGTLCEL
jgi:hypothetical protein